MICTGQIKAFESIDWRWRGRCTVLWWYLWIGEIREERERVAVRERVDGNFQFVFRHGDMTYLSRSTWTAHTTIYLHHTTCSCSYQVELLSTTISSARKVWICQSKSAEGIWLEWRGGNVPRSLRVEVPALWVSPWYPPWNRFLSSQNKERSSVMKEWLRLHSCHAIRWRGAVLL